MYFSNYKYKLNRSDILLFFFSFKIKFFKIIKYLKKINLVTHSLIVVEIKNNIWFQVQRI